MNDYQKMLFLSSFISDNSYNVNGNTLNEAAQTNLTDAILTKMFELTVGKYNKIDFSSIEKSRGDVTKTKFYKNLEECINTLIDIHTVTDKIPSIIIVSEALSNLRDMKSTFEYNFRIKNNCAIMIYNTIYYAIMEATSYIIATSIDVTKDGEYDKVNVHAIDGKTSCLINSLTAFNASVTDNSIMKFMKQSAETVTTQTEAISDIGLKTVTDFITDHRKEIKTAGITIGATVGILYLGAHIIPIIREIVYWIYKARHKLSETFEMQAEFLDLNIESLEHMDPNAIAGRTKFLKKKITTEQLITKQKRYADKFRARAARFALDSDKTDRDSKLDIKQDKVDVSNIVI